MFDERGVGQDKEPLIAILKLLGFTPGSVNWCQSIEDDSNCRNVILKHLSIVVKFLHTGMFDGRGVGQDKKPLIAILKLLGLTPGSANWCQNIEDDSNCHNTVFKHLGGNLLRKEPCTL